MAGVDADRQVQAGSFLIDREKVRVAYLPVQVISPFEKPARAVVFGPSKFFNRFIGIQQRQHGRPVQPAVAPGATFGNPAIVGLGERLLCLGIGGIVPDKEGWEDHLRSHVHAVHVFQAARHVL